MSTQNCCSICSGVIKAIDIEQANVATCKILIPGMSKWAECCSTIKKAAIDATGYRVPTRDKYKIQSTMLIMAVIEAERDIKITSINEKSVENILSQYDELIDPDSVKSIRNGAINKLISSKVKDILASEGI